MTAARSSHRRLSRHIITGLAAACGLLALVMGPLLLVVVAYEPGGYPLPPAGLSATGQLSDAAIVDLLAGTLLVTWLRWMACLAVEAAAVVRGGALPRVLPLLSGFEQVCARRLLTAALGMITTAGPIGTASAATPATVSVHAVYPLAGGAHGPEIHAAGDSLAGSQTLEPDAATGSSAALKPYRVPPPRGGHSESLWSIAERYLGSGRRYREIYALNKDRVQPDGQRLTLAHLIRPGWTLLLPSDATGLSDEPTRTPSTGHAAVDIVVQPGDTLSGIADRYLGDARRYHEIFAANAGRPQPDGTRLGDPDRILPGLRLHIPGPSRPTTSPAPPHRPPSDQPSPPGRRPRPHPTTPSATSHQPGPSRESAPAPAPAPRAPQLTGETGRPEAKHPQWTAPAWALTGILLATSVAGVVRFRRRRRDSHVQPGQTIPPPDRRLAALHATVGHTDDLTATQRIGAALATLAAAPPARDGATPVPQVLLRRPDGTIDVYHRDPVNRTQEPWTSTAGGRIWTLPADAAVNPHDGPSPCPALVQLGDTEDGAELYVDLEAIGVLAIDAAGAELRAIARAITATLTLSPLADLTRLRSTGFDPYGLVDEERLTAETTAAALIEHTATDLTPIAAGLARGGAPTTFALRATDTSDSWEPTVAVLGTALTGPAASRLAELAGDGGTGLAVVAAAHPDLHARWHLTLHAAHADRAMDHPRWRLDPLGIELTPLKLAAEELADLTALLASASAPAEPVPQINGTAVHAASPAAAQSAPVAEPSAAAMPDGPKWTVMIRLLGPIDVVDRTGQAPLTAIRDRTLEVLTWLATHRSGSRVDLETAVWPGGASAGTIMNELSRARRLLRDLAGPDADDWLPARQLTLDRAVTTDLDLLRHHLTAAERHTDDPDRAVTTLEAALALVRGIPAGYPWLDAEIGSTLTTLPVTAATRLAELHLQRHDPDRALAATTHGLTVLPAHTPLFAIRMRIAANHGPAAVKAEYDAYLRAEQADPFYDGETDRELQLLYQQLLRGLRRAADPRTSGAARPAEAAGQIAAISPARAI